MFRGGDPRAEPWRSRKDDRRHTAAPDAASAEVLGLCPLRGQPGDRGEHVRAHAWTGRFRAQEGAAPEPLQGSHAPRRNPGTAGAAAGGGSRRHTRLRHLSAEGPRAARRVPPPAPGALPPRCIRPFFLVLAEPEDGADFGTFGPDGAWVTCDTCVVPSGSFHPVPDTARLAAAGPQPDRASRQIVGEGNEDERSRRFPRLVSRTPPAVSGRWVCSF